MLQSKKFQATDELRVSVLRCLASTALMSDCQIEQMGGTPVTREHLVKRFGEAVALAWDDFNAAKSSFWREVNRSLLPVEESRGCIDG